MSDLAPLRRAYCEWIGSDGPHHEHTPDLVDAYVNALEAEVQRLTKLAEVGQGNCRALWSALRMVRDAIEEVGPVGALPSVEHEGVEPHEVAEHLVAAIGRLTAERDEAQRMRCSEIAIRAMRTAAAAEARRRPVLKAEAERDEARAALRHIRRWLTHVLARKNPMDTEDRFNVKLALHTASAALEAGDGDGE